MNTIDKSHQDLVQALCKPGADILSTLTPQQAHLWHMTSLLCSEAGELMDAIKKHVIYNKNLDVSNVIEELGDIEFSLQGIRQALFLTRDGILSANSEKLQKRYGSTYSDQAAQERKDKQ